MKLLTAMLAIVLVTGCTTQAQIVMPNIESGSKSDGTVRMVWLAGPKDTANADAARRKALERCQSWGYTEAEPFDTIRGQCTIYNEWIGCTQHEYSMSWQCID